MKAQRESRTSSVCRDNSVEENLAWWEEMKKATEFGLQCCVRAKIDMNSNNGALRDPTIYRCKKESHVRTGNNYNVYPLYDFACPIVDSVEGVTHALRTSEYNDRNDQYAWMCQAVGLRCPIVIDYSRLALQNTLLSKRKLTWFVEKDLVDGWDDPRMPTVSGILRRGMTAEGLRQFILAQGSSRSSAQMEWDKIWAFNKKVIDPVAPRHTGLLRDPTLPSSDDAPRGLVRVRIHGQSDVVEKQVPIHPKNEHLGDRGILLGPLIFIEHADAVCLKQGENVTLINWGNCRVLSVHQTEQFVSGVNVELNLADTNYKKTLKITWLADPGPTGPALTPLSCLIYDHLLTKAVITKGDDFKLFINRNSKTEQCLLGDHGLRFLKKSDTIQLQRRGYYICDAPYDPKCPATGHESPCVLIQIPEGTAKPDATPDSSTSEPKGSARAKAKPVVQLTEEEATKVAERKRKKDEKKEARKEGRNKWKLSSQLQQPTHSESVVPTKSVQLSEPVQSATNSSAIAANKETNFGESKSQAKKQTKLALEARKEVDFADWYTQLLTKAELLEYYDISGCYILRPWAYSIWQSIQRFMDTRLELMGIENAYFPMFVSKAALEREQRHLEDFAPEVFCWLVFFPLSSSRASLLLCSIHH
ncbi:hypothetical protein P879_09424 [Paragonimus westermani]|uniref:Glutamyl-tRNA synthetase n=1 Tax=Paragonimus westermani TaxID=34504 RepID=A0A8T0D7S2_9TREM|nr:hypothetical protein P879_09424 [Paragonimus westermani]